MDIAHGKILNYVSKSGLNLNEILQIAKAARRAEYLDSYVEWCQTALKFTKDENQREKILDMIEDAKEDHDEKYLDFEMLNPYKQSKPVSFKVSEKPYFPSKETENQQEQFKVRKEIIENSFSKNYAKNPIDKFFPMFDYAYRSEYFLRSRIRNLCHGNFSRPGKLDKDLNCILLHHQNPYLKLGPFKAEFHHKNPEIITIHDLGTFINHGINNFWCNFYSL